MNPTQEEAEPHGEPTADTALNILISPTCIFKVAGLKVSKLDIATTERVLALSAVPLESPVTNVLLS